MEECSLGRILAMSEKETMEKRCIWIYVFFKNMLHHQIHHKKANIPSMQVKVGDKVLYSKFAGTEVKFEGKEYLVIKQTDILAIL